jgi:hypothetical protein
VSNTFYLHPSTNPDFKPGVYETDPSTKWKVKNGYNFVKLFIYNKRDQQTISSSTGVVGKLTSQDILQPQLNQITFVTDSANVSREAMVVAPVNAKVFSFVFRFHYTENNSDHKYLDWNIGTVKSTHLTGGDRVICTYAPSSFFNYLTTNIVYIPGVTRSVSSNSIELRITFGGDDLSTYVDVNEPSIGIIQERPQYSNITGGLGIFSSRSSFSKFYSLDENSTNFLKDSLNLGFE